MVPCEPGGFERGERFGAGQKYFQDVRSRESQTDMEGGMLFLGGRGDALVPSGKHREWNLKVAE